MAPVCASNQLTKTQNGASISKGYAAGEGSAHNGYCNHWRFSALRSGRNVRYRLLATVLKVVLRLVPIVVNAPMAATAITEALSPYSIDVTPHSPLSSKVRTFNLISCW